jgi:hypothetical protein
MTRLACRPAWRAGVIRNWPSRSTAPGARVMPGWRAVAPPPIPPTARHPTPQSAPPASPNRTSRRPAPTSTRPGSCATRRDQRRCASVEGSHAIIRTTTPAQLTAEQEPSSVDTDGFQLDPRIVEPGPVADVPQEGTDDDRDGTQDSDR